MSEFKSILLHLDSTPRCAERTRVAARMAETFHATVAGVYSVTPSVRRHPMSPLGPAGAIGLQRLDEDRRAQAYRSFADAAAASGRMRSESVAGDAIEAFENRALYCDLVVVGQRDEETATAAETPSDFVARLLIDSGSPVLVIPFAGSFHTLGQRVLVAWTETRESARAVAAALPWLRRAESVHAVCCGAQAATSLQRLQQHLSAHRVKVTVHADEERTDRAVSEHLLSRADAFGADLLVMGCYGHSRAREWVLGGVSRTMLRTMTLPVVMAH